LIKKVFPNPQSSREGGCAHAKKSAARFAGFLVSFSFKISKISGVLEYIKEDTKREKED
jgi:hypothetical protein